MTLEEQVAELIYDTAELSAYQSRTRLEVTGAEGGPIDVEFAARIERLRANIQGREDAIGAEMNFMVTKVNGLTAAVLLLAKTLDERAE